MNEQTHPGADAEDTDEAALLRRVAGGDREAMEELYHQYHPRLFKFTYRLTRSYGAADELVNDVLLVVWQSAASFRGESRVSTWIFGIAYRKAMRHMRRRSLRPAHDQRVEVMSRDESAIAETEDWVRQALDTLPPAQQLTVVLVFYLGLSYPEIAQATDCPVNTVKTRMFHARRKLRDFLCRSAGTDPDDGTQRPQHE